MAGSSLQAASHPAGSLWVVGCLTWIGGLHPHDFMPVTDASGPRNFWVMRQEKTLALAQVLQACAKEYGASTVVLCNAM